MSRASQAERAFERELELLDELYAEGRISLEQYRENCRELQRDLNAAYEEDREDAINAVNDEWGRF